MDIITNEQRIADLADNIVARTHEVYSYDTNIQNYEALLAAYPVEWPEHLEQYKGLHPHEAAALCPIEHIEELADVQQAERVSYLLKTEKVERAKANAVLQILLAQMPDNVAEEAITAAIARRGVVTNTEG
jgi:hypothetical protein